MKFNFDFALILEQATKITTPFQFLVAIFIIILLFQVIRFVLISWLASKDKPIPDIFKNQFLIVFISLVSIAVYAFSIFEKAELQIKEKVILHDQKRQKYKNELIDIWQQYRGKEYLKTELVFEAAAFENKHLTIEEIIKEPNKLDLYYEMSKNNMLNLINQNLKK